MSRRFIPLDQLETLKRARELNEVTRSLEGTIARHATDRLLTWIESKQEQPNV